MASAAGGSGAGGGDRCPSGDKGTTRVGRRSKKPSAFHRAALRYLEKEYRECMTRGEEFLRQPDSILGSVRKDKRYSRSTSRIATYGRTRCLTSTTAR